MSTTRKRLERLEARAACDAYVEARNAALYPGTLAGHEREQAAYRAARESAVLAAAVYFCGVRRVSILATQKAMRATRRET